MPEAVNDLLLAGAALLAALASRPVIDALGLSRVRLNSPAWLAGCLALAWAGYSWAPTHTGFDPDHIRYAVLAAAALWTGLWLAHPGSAGLRATVPARTAPADRVG